jgi:hypothetical protein
MKLDIELAATTIGEFNSMPIYVVFKFGMRPPGGFQLKKIRDY